jgi:hypothetical protein
MLSTRISLIALLICYSAYGQSTGAVGGLSGSVNDLQGNPLPDAVVDYQRLYQTVVLSGGQLVPAPGETVMAGKVTADNNGAFSVTGLPVGKYLLCATVPNAPYLDPCSWGQAIPVTINSAAVSQQTISLTRGVFLKVRINDPMGLLPQSVDGAFGAGLSIGAIFGNGAWLNTQNINVDTSGRDYQMPIPAGMPLNLWLHSSRFSLVDSGGSTIAASGFAVQIQAVANVDQTFTFAVSGPVSVSQPTAGFR